MYHALHASGHADQFVVQDLSLPQSSASEFIQFIDRELGIYPLWLCPFRQGPSTSLISHESKLNDQRGAAEILNVGIWGPGPTNRDAFLGVNRKLEQKLHSLGGLKWMYARVYYTEDEFWDIYDRKTYDGLRAKYHATLLPNVYDKVKTDVGPKKRNTAAWSYLPDVWNIWPIPGLYGAYRATLGLYTPYGKNYIVTK
jgi:Delta24-sterol reductase